MIRIDAIWLSTEPMDMRAGTDTALARVIAVFGAAKPHCAYLFANRRATRMKVLVHDGFGIWLAARRLNQGKFHWPGIRQGSELELDTEQLQTLVLGLLTSPRAYKRRELAVAAVVTLGLDLLEKRFGAPAVVFWPERIGLERLFQRLVVRAEFVEGCAPLVRRLSGFGRSDPFSDGVSRKPVTLGYLMQRELVAEIHPPDFPNISMLITPCSPAQKVSRSS